MSERTMMNQRWEIGVEAAYAYNEARDAFNEASASLSAFDDIVEIANGHDLPGITIEHSARIELRHSKSDIQLDANHFETVVDLMIGRKVLGEDFIRIVEITTSDTTVLAASDAK